MRNFLTRTAVTVACMTLVASAAISQMDIPPQQYPTNSLGIHKIVLTDTGELYLFAEQPIGYGDLSPRYDNAALVDFANLFPSAASFDTFDSYSENQKAAAVAGAIYYVDWTSLNLDPGNIVAQGTILLDLNETDYAAHVAEFEDHIGAMAEAWKWVLDNPFSAGEGKVNIEGLFSDGELVTEETWGKVGKFVGNTASKAWGAGKWVAKKVLPVGQAVEFCATAANVVGSSIAAGELPAAEDMVELCFDAAECIPGGWGIGAAVAHEAWCWIDY